MTIGNLDRRSRAMLVAGAALLIPAAAWRCGLVGSSDAGTVAASQAIPIDENFVDHWNHNPYELSSGGAGNYVADGASFLLPYYMGLYHRYVVQ